MRYKEFNEAVSLEEYLESEKRADHHNEYLAGYRRMIPEGGDAHFAIRLNFAFLLKEHLSGGPCRIYVSDMKVRVAQPEAYLYPDLFVTCAADDLTQGLYKSHPTLIAEVLSDADSSFDRGSKFALYRQIPSLKQYILIDAGYPAVDSFRLENGRWTLYPSESGGSLEIPEFKFSCEIEDIYQDIFDAEDE
jgi:Uma2 family endonuclease